MDNFLDNNFLLIKIIMTFKFSKWHWKLLVHKFKWTSGGVSIFKQDPNEAKISLSKCLLKKQVKIFYMMKKHFVVLVEIFFNRKHSYRHVGKMITSIYRGAILHGGSKRYWNPYSCYNNKYVWGENQVLWKLVTINGRWIELINT